MTAEERALPEEARLARYNRRPARIYLDEEAVGGLPIRMEHFRLFDAEHRTSRPLCLAFEAPRLASPRLSETYLRLVRRTTIVEGQQTTRLEVLREMARVTGVHMEAYDRALLDGSAAAAFAQDEALAASLDVRGLPCLLAQVGEKGAPVSPLACYERICEVVEGLRS